MRGTSTSTLIIVAAVIAVVALAGLAVLRMGEVAGGGVSASVSLAEEGGVVTATIHVLKGALAGVAIKYIMPDGKSWWAKPIYCMAVNNTASVTSTAVYFSSPIPAGQAITCAFYIWAPSTGAYDLWILGYRPSGAGTVTFAQSRLHLSANKYGGNLPVGTMKSGTNALRLPPREDVPVVGIHIPVNWRGGVLIMQAEWGYNYTTCSYPVDGISLDFFVVPDAPRLVVQPHPWGSGDGAVMFGLWPPYQFLTAEPIGFNPSKKWPANTTWTTYLIYNATSNTLYLRWIVPGAFDLVYTYDLNKNPYNRWRPPPPGQYRVWIGLKNYGNCVTDWQLYSYTVATS